MSVSSGTCTCIKLVFGYDNGSGLTTEELFGTTTYSLNGESVYVFNSTVFGIIYLCRQPVALGASWYIVNENPSTFDNNDLLMWQSFGVVYAEKDITGCPKINNKTYQLGESAVANDVVFAETLDCGALTCDCGIQLIRDGESINVYNLTPNGEVNGRESFKVVVSAYLTYIIEFDPANYRWRLYPEATGINEAYLYYYSALCPIGDYFQWENTGGSIEYTSYGVECFPCGLEERTEKFYNAITLPVTIEEPERGDKSCCCENIVFAGSGKAYQDDVLSAWIKLSSVSDTILFKLYKNGLETNYTPTPVAFPNQQYAYYTTINWSNVLLSDGEGCYELKLEYEISGIQGILSWGNYKLMTFSDQRAIGTARVKAVFNGYQESEEIDFTGANVVSTHRFYGFIGKQQPNTEIDNVIYANREMKRVIRENLNDYEILTDPLQECQIKPLVELYLLSENELFVSDYNDFNYSYKFQDLPVILSESAKLEYYDQSRLAKLSCKVADKYKNKRTYY